MDQLNYSPSDFKKINQLKEQLLTKCEFCHCSQKKMYRCMEPTCIYDKLICPQCDVFALNGKHYSHRFSYVLPLLWNLQYSHDTITKKHKQMQTKLSQVKRVFQEIICSLQKILENNYLQEKQYWKCQQQNKSLKLIKERSQLNSLKSIDGIFEGVEFLSFDQYQDFMKKAVNYDQDLFRFQKSEPLFGMKNKIDEIIFQTLDTIKKPEQIKLPPPYLFTNQTIKLSSYDLEFRKNKDLYTDNWTHTTVKVQVGSLSRMIENFYKCRKIEIVDWGIKSEPQLNELPKMAEWIHFQNLKQLTITSISSDINTIIPFFEGVEAMSLNFNSIEKFKKLKEINLSLRGDKQLNLQFLENSTCQKLSIQSQNQVNMVNINYLQQCLQKNKQTFNSLYISNKMGYSGTKLQALYLDNDLPKLIKFEADIIQSACRKKRKLENYKAVSSLAKEYQLQKFIKNQKNTNIFGEIYSGFLIL